MKSRWLRHFFHNKSLYKADIQRSLVDMDHTFLYEIVDTFLHECGIILAILNGVESLNDDTK